MKNLVSIVCPIFNSEKYLSDTIISIKNQKYKNWQAILINDCSTDNSLNIIKSLISNDSRFTLIDNKKNMGVSYCRNIGIDISQGEFISFIDSDDFWDINKIDKQINFMLSNNYDFTYTNLIIIDDSSNITGYRNSPKFVDYKINLFSNWISTSSVILKRNLIGNIKFENIGWEDYAFWMKIFKKNSFAVLYPESLTYYRVHSSSLSSFKIKSAYKTWINLYLVENLGFLKSCFYFFSYIINGFLKRKKCLKFF